MLDKMVFLSDHICGWLLMGAADANHIWWLNTNPFFWFTAAPQFLSHPAPSLWLFKYALLLTALSPATK
jgi:hypothetical protein